MKFLIESNYKGVQVLGESNDFSFKSKLFSHSSVLLDKNKQAVVTLRRSSWWRMDFDLKANDKNYEFKQRFGNSRILAKESEIEFYTTSGHDFFIDGAAATLATPEGLTVKKYTIEILHTDHWLALLAATCLELQTSMVTKTG